MSRIYYPLLYGSIVLYSQAHHKYRLLRLVRQLTGCNWLTYCIIAQEMDFGKSYPAEFIAQSGDDEWCGKDDIDICTLDHSGKQVMGLKAAVAF